MQRRSHVETEAETGRMQPPAQGRLEPPELEKAGRPLPGGCVRGTAGDTWTSDAWSPGRGGNESCYLKPLGFSSFVTTTLGNAPTCPLWAPLPNSHWF